MLSGFVLPRLVDGVLQHAAQDTQDERAGTFLGFDKAETVGHQDELPWRDAVNARGVSADWFPAR
jgi:hypothetical protein